MYAVCVSFRTHPGAYETFRPLVMAQADTSLRGEPECHRFDVCGGAEDEIFLYELYTDAAAFQAHLKTPHFLHFDAAVAPLVAAKTVQVFDWVAEGGRDA